MKFCSQLFDAKWLQGRLQRRLHLVCPVPTVLPPLVSLRVYRLVVHDFFLRVHQLLVHGHDP